MANVYTDKCFDSELYISRDADANAIGDTFRGMVGNSIPIVGPLVAGLVPDTLTNNIVRQCPGVTLDKRSTFTVDYILLVFIVTLLISYYLL
tara:strand:- start:14101 stop:14376 length:276 start_codon:yes stop_codon:yes gene_type:complete